MTMVMESRGESSDRARRGRGRGSGRGRGRPVEAPTCEDPFLTWRSNSRTLHPTVGLVGAAAGLSAFCCNRIIGMCAWSQRWWVGKERGETRGSVYQGYSMLCGHVVLYAVEKGGKHFGQKMSNNAATKSQVEDSSRTHRSVACNTSRFSPLKPQTTNLKPPPDETPPQRNPPNP